MQETPDKLLLSITKQEPGYFDSLTCEIQASRALREGLPFQRDNNPALRGTRQTLALTIEHHESQPAISLQWMLTIETE